MPEIWTFMQLLDENRNNNNNIRSDCSGGDVGALVLFWHWCLCLGGIVTIVLGRIKTAAKVVHSLKSSWQS